VLRRIGSHFTLSSCGAFGFGRCGTPRAGSPHQHHRDLHTAITPHENQSHSLDLTPAARTRECYRESTRPSCSFLRSNERPFRPTPRSHDSTTQWATPFYVSLLASPTTATPTRAPRQLLHRTCPMYPTDPPNTQHHQPRRNHRSRMRRRRALALCAQSTPCAFKWARQPTHRMSGLNTARLRQTVLSCLSRRSPLPSSHSVSELPPFSATQPCPPSDRDQCHQ
jgi:hypothetical protein